MKCTLILDSLGPNPEHAPPQRQEFDSDEAHADAKALYDVPADVIVPAGTELVGPECWQHCVPDQAGLAIVDGKPKRVGPPIVRAVPADAGCEAAVAKWIAHHAHSRGLPPSQVRAALDKLIADSRGAQKKLDAAKAAQPS